MGKENDPVSHRDEERFRAIINDVQDGYYEVDLAGNFVFVNAAMCQMFDYAEEELLGMNYKEYLDPVNAEKVYEVFNQVFRTGEPVSEFEYEVRSAQDNSTRVIQSSVAVVRSVGGQPVGFRGISRDITKREQVAQALQQAHDQLEQRIAERTSELIQANEALKSQIAERSQAEIEIEKNYQSQRVLNALLQLSHVEIPLETQLEHAFDLLRHVPWLGSMSQGGIFLVEDDPQVLVLKTQHTLDEPLRQMCARVPFGSCLCGQAAATGQTVFADCLDYRHDRTYEGIVEHGHYNIPIELDNQIAGVINLYLEPGHQQDPNEVAFLETVANTLAGIIKRKRVEAQIDQLVELRGRQVQLSTQVAQEIAAAADLDDLYLRVVTQIKEQFNYYHTQLLRYDPALDTVALVVGYGEVGDKMLAMHHSIPMGVGIIGTVAKTGQSLLKPDVSQDDTWQSNPLLPRTKGELAVPIKLGEQVLGVLDVQSDVTNALNREDQLLLEGLCGQIAVAIDSTRLRQSMEARLRELNSLQRYMSREGWNNYRASSTRSLGYEFGHAGVQPIRPQTGFLSLHRLPMANPQNGNSDDSRPMINVSIPGTVSAPLTVRGQPIGTLGIVEDPNQPFSSEEKELFTSITEQVAEALEVARLFEQTQQSLAEQERLAAELETVAQVSTAASTLLEIDTLLQSVVDLAMENFGLYHAHIYLADESGKKLVLRAGAGSIGRLMVLQGREVEIDSDSLIAEAARERQATLKNDVRKTVNYLPHPLLPNTKAEMVVPLVVGDTLIGILNLQSDKVDYFTTEDMQIQKTLAAQVAVAVQNAFRYSEQVTTAAQLRQVDQLKSEFLASMSHELRTPLNSIIGFADVLLEGLDGGLNDRMEEDVRLIRDSGDHLRCLIGDILDMSKIEAGRMELRYEQIDMRQIASDIISTANPLAHEKSLALYADIAPDVGAVEADRTRLRQILWNIVGNAIKFTEEGAVILSMQLQEDNLLVSVRDTGIGIKPENIPIVFEQFRQVDGSLNRSVGGTGLGMPITKNLIELHGGNIWVESVLGQGSTFWFTLPVKKPRSRSVTSPLPSLEELNLA